jgi:hypothetical protein
MIVVAMLRVVNWITLFLLLYSSRKLSQRSPKLLLCLSWRKDFFVTKLLEREREILQLEYW